MSWFLNFKSVGYFLLVVSLVGLSGCGLLRESGVPAPEMEMTETGIATGAVIGAGMGALVGSVSGQAGAGLVVGSVAGAATGGVIGKALEDQEKRIDSHDSSLGVNTTARSSESAASNSSSRSKLWSRVGEVDRPDIENLQASRNRPSGDKGIAARYNSVGAKRENFERMPVNRAQLNRDSSVSSEVIQLQQDRSPVRGSEGSDSFPEAKQTAQSEIAKANIIKPRLSDESFNSEARIELQKPKPELPDLIDNSFAASRSPSSSGAAPVIRKPTLGNETARVAKDNSSAMKTSGLPPAKSRAETQSIQKIELAKRDTTTPVIAPKKEEKSSVNAAAGNSRARIAEPEAVDAGALSKGIVNNNNATSTIDSNVKEDTTRVENSVVEKTTPVAKAVNAPAQAAQGGLSCEKGKKEVERAKNSPSDSDKVFYLRRAILACPEEANLRVELGKVYGRLGLKDDARKEYTAALEADPANDSAQDELSIMMLEGQ